MHRTAKGQRAKREAQSAKRKAQNGKTQRAKRPSPSSRASGGRRGLGGRGAGRVEEAMSGGNVQLQQSSQPKVQFPLPSRSFP